jgi:hypothetical protein
MTVADTAHLSVHCADDQHKPAKNAGVRERDVTALAAPQNPDQTGECGNRVDVNAEIGRM